jgi:hypothetical protein
MTIQTDELINILSSDCGKCCRRKYRIGLAVTLTGGILIALIASLVTAGWRPDLSVALHQESFDMKLVFCGVVFAIASVLFSRILCPYDTKWNCMAPLMLPFAVIVLLASREVMAAPSFGVAAETWAAPVCMGLIIAFSVLPLVLFLSVARFWAPARPDLAGAAAGLCAGSAGAFAYALHCTHDHPLFVALWYTGGILIVTAAGYVAGRILRW